MAQVVARDRVLPTNTFIVAAWHSRLHREPVWLDVMRERCLRQLRHRDVGLRLQPLIIQTIHESAAWLQMTVEHLEIQMRG